MRMKMKRIFDVEGANNIRWFFLKNKKAAGFSAPTALMIEIPNDQSMSAPRVGIMGIILYTFDMVGLLVVMLNTICLCYIVLHNDRLMSSKNIQSSLFFVDFTVYAIR